MFLEAYQLFKDKSYLDSALECGEVIWYRGLLQKGPGLCHGITGNAYFLLSIYRFTKDEKWLDRALIFARLSFNPKVSEITKSRRLGRKVKGVPDEPYSLMEGSAGDIVFYADIIRSDIELSRFPGYEI